MSLKKFLLDSPSMQKLEKLITSKRGQRDNATGDIRKGFQVELNALKSDLDEEKKFQTKEYSKQQDAQKNSTTSSGVSNYAHSMMGASNASNAVSAKGF